jgi:hypothetical protein
MTTARFTAVTVRLLWALVLSTTAARAAAGKAIDALDPAASPRRRGSA